MNSDPNKRLDFLHDRDHVRMLQHAHADHIEAGYRNMLAVAGNPFGVVIENINGVRTFIAKENRLENRAIFNGDESEEAVDAVLRHFAGHGSNLVIEVNPANYYVNPPVTWEKRLLKHLLRRGCQIHDFRCVWARSHSLTQAELASTCWIDRFHPEQIERFIERSRMVDPQREWTPSARAFDSHPALVHYIVWDDQAPAASGTLFLHHRCAYLQSWYTHPDHRSKGFQQAGILARVKDAFEAGAQLAFTVTDFNFTSPRNLQRCGFSLAYNYLLLRRDPAPLE